MQNKLTKKFIYTWFKEDYHGEFTLYKLTDKFTISTLGKVWNFIIKRKNLAVGSLLNNIFLPLYTNYIALFLRDQFLFKNNLFSLLTFRNSFYGENRIVPLHYKAVNYKKLFFTYLNLFQYFLNKSCFTHSKLLSANKNKIVVPSNNYIRRGLKSHFFKLVASKRYKRRIMRYILNKKK